jgi:hypothetical protein
VDEAQLLALLDAAGVTPSPDLTRQEFGVILTHAKGGNPLMGPLLMARSDLAPLYKLRTAEGRPWRPSPAPTTELGPTT